MSAKTETRKQRTNPTEPGADGDRAVAIARLAYEKWQARGCPMGDDGRDWFEAEKEILGAQPTTAVGIAFSRPDMTS